jgi:transposase
MSVQGQSLQVACRWAGREVRFGPKTDLIPMPNWVAHVSNPLTYYNRFVRWRPAGVWDQITDARGADHNAAVRMIDTSVVRVHQH